MVSNTEQNILKEKLIKAGIPEVHYDKYPAFCELIYQLAQKETFCKECGFPISWERNPVFVKSDIFSLMKVEENKCNTCGHQKDGYTIKKIHDLLYRYLEIGKKLAQKETAEKEILKEKTDYTKINYTSEWFMDKNNQAHTIQDVNLFNNKDCNNIIQIGEHFLLDLISIDNDVEIWEVENTKKLHNVKGRGRLPLKPIRKITTGKQFGYPNGYWKIKETKDYNPNYAEYHRNDEEEVK